jgi:hypothetical protein
MRLTVFRITITLVTFCLVLQAGAYPLDGRDLSGIKRLTGYLNAQSSPQGPKIVAGGLLGLNDILLNLVESADIPDFDLAARLDPGLQRSIDSIFKNRDPSYSAVVIDITNPDQLATALVRPDTKQNAGSVGKILTMLALFDSLAIAFPDTEDRARVLRDTDVLAGEWVLTDSHKVPKYSEETKTNRFSAIDPSDRFKLSEWIDHMVSPSANAAGSVVWREAMLIRHFGNAYPVSQQMSDQFFNQTPKPALFELSQQVARQPLRSAGINIENLQQGSFWTRTGKAKVPGTQSFATARELARFMFRLEQGRLVDRWSSLEMKRYLYMTKRRYRYVYGPELHQSAVFFKSGSFFQCQPEENFKCGKYMGNKRNLMNSVVTIESLPGSQPAYRYIVAMMSNVLKVNSAWDHSRLGAAIHEAVMTRGAVKVEEDTDEKTIKDAGQS